jgi:hypothetical protein
MKGLFNMARKANNTSAVETTSVRTSYKAMETTLITVDGVKTALVSIPVRCTGDSPLKALAAYVGLRYSESQRKAATLINKAGNIEIDLGHGVSHFIAVERNDMPQDGTTYAIIDSETPSWVTVKAATVDNGDDLAALLGM